MRGMTLRQLRVLAAAASTRSVTGAAKALNVTPPAIIWQLKEIEQAAGVTLLERGRDGLRPTDAGREVLVAGRRVEAALGECAESLAALRGAGGGRVSVGVVSTAKYFAPRALGAFSRAHPGIEIRLAVRNRGDTIAALENYEFDVAVMGRPPEQLDVERAAIGDHPHIVVAPPDHPLARRRLEIRELAGETFLLREEGSGTRLLTQRLFANSGINPRIGMEIGSNETIKQAVMAGLGIALISAHTVAAELGDGRLVSLAVDGLPIVRQWYAVKRRDKRLLPAGQAMWDFLVTEGAGFLPRIVPAASKPRRRQRRT